MASDKLSPMMKQYMAIKDEYNDCILMFRLGDFYEMFFDDAILASAELEIALTGRNCGLEEKAPMCGVPYHSVDSYIAKLVKNGHKVAICEQMQDPSETKGIVQRDIVRVFTPGTLDISDTIDKYENIYIGSVFISENSVSLAIADISTGELILSEFLDNEIYDRLFNEIARYGIKELIINKEQENLLENTFFNNIKIYINSLDSSFFSYKSCESAVISHFDMQYIGSIGIETGSIMVNALGSLLIYLSDMGKQAPSQLKKLIIKIDDDSIQIDKSTMRNLELLETIYDKDVKGSLFGVLNKTKTAMGARLLKSWLRSPLKKSDLIRRRLDGVEEIKDNFLIFNNVVNSLKNIYDIQRLTSRIASAKANARDLIALKSTLQELPDIKNNLSFFNSEILSDICNNISDFHVIYDLIDKAISDNPPMILTEGNIIKQGYSKELDELKNSISDAKQWIAELESTEKKRTGIKTLKVGFNKVFGYYIDVSKGMLDKVPDDYIRRQTLVNNERYITQELKEKENLVFNAETKINKIEYEEFKKIRLSIEPYIEQLQTTAAAVSELDVLISLAKVAFENNYAKPVIDDSYIIDIKNGRHPAVEQIIGNGMFVSNDTFLNKEDISTLIITGPNMSGKSTYMRQTAVIVLMAQIGSFVPADSAHIGVVDRIFTRIGASDNLAYGQSTFFIEMSELSNILRNSTDRSLIILDEIGRGTSTFDGLSIAWATAEYLSDDRHLSRTMFATHYHELTQLEEVNSHIKNLSVSVSEDGENIVFLHNIVEGPASKSYGIHVAKIAGIPADIRKRARVMLSELEKNSNHIKINEDNSPYNEQLTLIDKELIYQNEISKYDEECRNFIKNIVKIDINNLTPVAAMNKLNEIIDEACEITEII